jgi:DNA polymerase
MKCVRLAHPADFEGWREAARRLDGAGLTPDDVRWNVEGEQASLLDEPPSAPLPEGKGRRVPAAFVELAKDLVCHSDPGRFDLAYRLLRRLRDEPGLLEIATDPMVARARLMARSVRRDLHKMKAFVRFREARAADGRQVMLAWHEPDHHVVDLAAPFFVGRFAGMAWSILTPRHSLHWDGETLTHGPGASRRDVPDEDRLEEHWRVYFASIFNPARLKPQAMRAEMPKKFWPNLPESRLIAPLMREAARRSEAMVMAAPTEARRASRATLPVELPSLDERTPEGLRQGLAACARCGLCRMATQVVPGEGPMPAPLMLVGEQPGDQEDLQGRPFVGPAGNVLDRALARVGIDRAAVYLTNAVKHFKFEPRGKRRIHQRPDAGEIEHCRWWLDLECQLVQPKLVVALGATALRGLRGPGGAIGALRGRLLPMAGETRLLVTVHPSYLLRLPDRDRQREEYRRFVDDLALAREAVGNALVAA